MAKNEEMQTLEVRVKEAEESVVAIARFARENKLTADGAADTATKAADTATGAARKAADAADLAEQAADHARHARAAAELAAENSGDTGRVIEAAQTAKATADAAAQAVEAVKTEIQTASSDAAAAKNKAEAAAQKAAETAQQLTLLPTTVSKAVGEALGSPDAPSKIIEEQIRFDAEQVDAYVQISVQGKRYYLEDALPSDLRNKVLTRWYRNNKRPDEALQIVQAIQTWADNLPEGVYITTRGGVFPLTKNKGYAPDFYGADGRVYNAKTDYLSHLRRTGGLDGQQPCVSFRSKSGCVFDFSQAVFIVEEYGQDAFHLCGGSQNNIIIHAGTIRTRAYLDLGYKGYSDGLASHAKMLFPPIDGTKPGNWLYGGSGCADKGYPEAGFNTCDGRGVELSLVKNNAAKLENLRQPEGYNRDSIKGWTIAQSSKLGFSVGGYFDENGESMFPQDDGTFAPTWGKWRGGQHGSRGYGWCLFGVKNTRVMDFDISGFSGCAFSLGLHSVPSAESQVAANDTAEAYRLGLVAENTSIFGGTFNHNYTGGIELIRVSGVMITGIHQKHSVVGHPDASIAHHRGWGTQGFVQQPSLDPGYCICTSRYLPMDNIRIVNNVFGTGKRKVIDAHTGNNIWVSGNSGRALYYGISIVIQEQYAGDLLKNGAPANRDSFAYEDSFMVIENNDFESANIGIHLTNGSEGVAARVKQNLWYLRANTLVQNNRIRAPRGIQCDYGHDGFRIIGNTVTFAYPGGDVYGLDRISSLEVVSGGSGYTSVPDIVIRGGGKNAGSAEIQAVVENGRVTSAKLLCPGVGFTETPIIEVVGGGGEGAVITAAVNSFTYGMTVGAQTSKGDQLGTKILYNKVQNSPEGNFARQYTFQNLNGAVIAFNDADITAYHTVAALQTKFDKYPEGRRPTAKAGIPFTAADDMMKYRDGIVSAGFYPTVPGGLNGCELIGNLTVDRNAGLGNTVVKTPWFGGGTIKNHLVTIPGIAEVNTEIAAIKSELAKLKAAIENTASDSSNRPSETNEATETSDGTSNNNGSGTLDTAVQPENDNRANQPSVIVFDWTDNRLTDNTGRFSVTDIVEEGLNPDRFEDKTSRVHTADSPRFIQTRLLNPNASAGTRLNITGINFSGKGAIVMPIRITGLGSGKTHYLFAAADASAGKNSAEFILKSTGAQATVATPNSVRDLRGAAVNGTELTADTQIKVGEWFVLTVSGHLAGADFTLGSNNNGNTSISADFGEGLKIYPDGASAEQIAADVAALKEKYGIN